MASKPNPSETCDTLLNYLKKSNLNFHIEESPFAVTINIKKSLKRKKWRLKVSQFFWNLRYCQSESQVLLAEKCAMKFSLAYSEAERETFRQTVRDLERKLKEKVVISHDQIWNSPRMSTNMSRPDTFLSQDIDPESYQFFPVYEDYMLEQYPLPTVEPHQF